MCCKYRSVPLIRPPILYTTSSVKWRGGLIFEYAICLEYKPPPQSLRERYIHFQSSCLHKNTVTKAFYTKQLIQDRESWSRTSRLQSFYLEEELSVQREVNNIHDDFAVAVQQYCRSCTTGTFQSLLVPPAQEWQRDDL